MKRITISILFTILTLGLICNAYAQTAHNLWPVQLGNQWTYMIEGPINNGDKFKAEVTKRSYGWAYIDATPEFYGTGWEDQWWYMSRYSGNIWALDTKNRSFGRVFNLKSEKGYCFTSKIRGIPCLNESIWMVTDVGVSVDTPVGTFENCLIIDNIDPPCADAGLTRVIFTPKVGPIEYSWTTIAGGHTAKLVHAIVDGTEYSQIVYTGGYSVYLNIDKITYTLLENQMPPEPPGGFPQHPDTLKVRLSLVNLTNQTISFEHICSQEYDFIIRDESETEVYRWSNDKGFADSPVTRILAPGKFLNYEEEIELRDNDKNPLQPGNYTIEGLHTTRPDKPQQRAIAAFNIELSTVH